MTQMVEIKKGCKYAIIFDFPLTMAQYDRIRMKIDKFLANKNTDFIILDNGARLIEIVDKEIDEGID